MGSIRVGWWNLQNLFDTDDDPISADLEFTVATGWTPEVYATKLANLAVAIRELHAGQGSGGKVGSPRHRHVAGLRRSQASPARAAFPRRAPAVRDARHLRGRLRGRRDRRAAGRDRHALALPEQGPLALGTGADRAGGEHRLHRPRPRPL